MLTISEFEEKYKNCHIDDIRDELETNPLSVALYFSRLAYKSPYQIFETLQRFDCLNFSVYNKNDTQAFFVEFEDFAAVGFQGTRFNHLTAVVSDLIFWKTEYLGVQCHEGFVDSIERVSTQLKGNLSKLDPNKKLLFTGHSLRSARWLYCSLWMFTHLI